MRARADEIEIKMGLKDLYKPTYERFKTTLACIGKDDEMQKVVEKFEDKIHALELDVNAAQP
jgi:hypothetical protein